MPGPRPKPSSVVPVEEEPPTKDDVSTKEEETYSNSSTPEVRSSEKRKETTKRNKTAKNFADGEYVRIASADEMDRLSNHRWTHKNFTFSDH